MFCVLIVVVVTQLCALVKTCLLAYLKMVTFIVKHGGLNRCVIFASFLKSCGEHCR